MEDFNYVQSMQASENELKQLRTESEALRLEILQKVDEAAQCAREIQFEKAL